MSAYHTLDEMLNGLNAAQERFQHSLDEACRDAAALSVEMLSADESVKIALSGDFRVTSLSIHPRRYDEHDAASLRAAILSAYRRAVIALNRAQHLTILSTVAPHTREAL
jgi:DNA-binding protein YbaB